MAYFQANTGDKIYFDRKIHVKMISPIFGKMNTISFPFDVSSTVEIELIFDRAKEINVENNKVRVLDGFLIAGRFRLIGTLRIKHFRDKYRCNFTGQGNAYSILNQKKMSEMDLGNAPFTDFFNTVRTTLNECFFYLDNKKAYCFPPHNNFLFSSKYPFKQGDTAIVNYFLINRYPRTNTEQTIPSFFVSYITETILEKSGFVITENALNSELYRNLVALSNYSFHLAQFEEIEGRIFNISDLNASDDKVVLTLTDNSFGLISVNSFAKLYDLNIPNARNFEGRVVQITEKSSEDSTVTLDVDSKDFKNSTYPGKLVLMSLVADYPDEFDIAKQFPEMMPLDFFKSLKDLGLIILPDESKKSIRIKSFKDIFLDNNYIDISNYSGKLTRTELIEISGYDIRYKKVNDEYYNERIKDLNANQIIKNPVETLGDLPISNNEINDLRFVVSEGLYYIWDPSNYGSRQINSTTSINLGNWSFYSEPYLGITGGEKPKKIEINLAPVPLWKDDRHNFSAGRTIPRMDVPCNTSFSREKTNIGLRLLFLDKLDSGFPLASDENKYFSLKITGEKGLFNTVYKYLFHWQHDIYRPASCKINWPENLLNSFRWDKKYRIKNTNFLIEEIDFYILPDDSIEFGNSKVARI